MKKNNFLKSSGFYVLIFLAIIAVVSMITGGMETETSQDSLTVFTPQTFLLMHFLVFYTDHQDI